MKLAGERYISKLEEQRQDDGEQPREDRAVYVVVLPAIGAAVLDAVDAGFRAQGF